MNGSPREPRGPAGSTRGSVGARCKGQPEQGVEPRSGVGPVHSTVEPLEGNERGEGRDRPGGSPPEKAGVRTQSRFALPLKLWRVYEAAQRNKQARFTALLHHVDVIALERAFRRLKRSASPGVDGEAVTTYEQSLQSKLHDLCERVHTESRPLEKRPTVSFEKLLDAAALGTTETAVLESLAGRLIRLIRTSAGTGR